MTQALLTHSITDPALARIADLIRELIIVLTDENHLLASGIPASLAETTERKVALAEELERVMAASADRRPAAAAQPEIRAMLADGIIEARRVASENGTRLAAALEASRRRIAAVMSAIREQTAQDCHAYGANGRRPVYAAPGAISRGRII